MFFLAIFTQPTTSAKAIVHSNTVHALATVLAW
jgi:hypothetical protein